MLFQNQLDHLKSANQLRFGYTISLSTLCFRIERSSFFVYITYHNTETSAFGWKECPWKAVVNSQSPYVFLSSVFKMNLDGRLLNWSPQNKSTGCKLHNLLLKHFKNCICISATHVFEQFQTVIVIMHFQTYLFVCLFPNYYNYITLQVTVIQCQAAIKIRKDLVMSESSHNLGLVPFQVLDYEWDNPYP